MLKIFSVELKMVNVFYVGTMYQKEVGVKNRRNDEIR